MHDRYFCFSKYMLCLEHLVVCSYPENPLLGKCFSCTWLLSQLPPFHFGCGYFLKPWKLTTLMKHLGGMVWLVVDSWVATQDYVHLWWFNCAQEVILVVEPYGSWALCTWLSSPEGALVTCHPGTKRFVGLQCFSWLSVQPYGKWALPRWSKLWGFILLSRQADVA